MAKKCDHWTESTAGREEGWSVVRWAQGQRIAFIHRRLLRPGWFNRGHLMAKFGISMPQASTDIRQFQELYPTEMQYNKSAKRYEAL